MSHATARTPSTTPQPPLRAEPVPHRWLPWLVAAVVGLALSPTLRNAPCPIDDPLTIFSNPRLNPPDWRGSDGVRWYWRHAEMALYIPVTYMVWATLASATYVSTPDEAGYHLDARVFHGANLLVHVGNTLLVYALLSRLLGKLRAPPAAAAAACEKGESHAPPNGRTARLSGSPWPIAIGALLYGAHPIQVEAVAWTSGMKDLLYTTFALVATLLYLRAIDPQPGGNRVANEEVRWWRHPSYWAGMAMVVIGMMCKPTAMVTPLIVAALDRWIIRRPARQVIASASPYALATVPLAIVARIVQTTVGVPTPPIGQRFLIASASLTFYLGKLIAPVHFAFDYGWRPDDVLHWPSLPALSAASAALGLILWLGRRRWPIPLAAGAIFAAALLPVLGLAPFQMQSHSTVADHYALLAMTGPALAAAWALSLVPAGRPATIAAVAASVACAALAVISSAQMRTWHDEWSYNQQIVAVNPSSSLAHNGLGVALQHIGNYKAAEREYKLARARHEYRPSAENLAALYAITGRPDDAIALVHEYPAIDADLPPEYHRKLDNAMAKLAIKANEAGYREDVPKYEAEFRRYRAEAERGAATAPSTAPYTPPARGRP